VTKGKKGRKENVIEESHIESQHREGTENRRKKSRYLQELTRIGSRKIIDRKKKDFKITQHNPRNPENKKDKKQILPLNTTGQAKENPRNLTEEAERGKTVTGARKEKEGIQSKEMLSKSKEKNLEGKRSL